VSWQQLPL